MANAVQNEYLPEEVSPPGTTLREVLNDRGVSQSDLATRMGRPKKTISEIINGKASVTPETALELELVLGIPASFWNARERDYRASLARLEQARRMSHQLEWMKNFPVRELAKNGWIPKQTDRKDRLKALLQFFGVASADQWQAVFDSVAVAFRKSSRFESNSYSLGAWLRCGQIEAEQYQCRSFHRDRFVSALHEIRSLTPTDPEVFEPEMKRVCADAGVAVAFVPQLPRSRVSGATRWLSADKALIQLSIRYRTNDHLWFTFFHEAAHIVLHGKRLIFLETGHSSGELEEEANRWAAEFLIPTDAYEEFVDTGTYTKAAIRRFADSIGVAPGIVVGRLQHDEELPHNHCNDLKVRLVWARDAEVER
jgi:HTH-type transcriptional regulator / antitoxin HigA